MRFVVALMQIRIRKLFAVISFGITTIFVNSGIHASDYYNSADSQFSQFRNQIINDINKQRAAYNEDLRILKRQGNACANEIQSLSEVIQDLLAQISQMKSKIGSLEQENAQLNSKLNSNINKLGALINEERSARQKADQNVIREVSVELSNASRRTDRKSHAGDAGSGIGQTHHLYEVVKGDTLGAIAKAFNVSLNRLKTLNNLKSDTIYVGQKLKVP